MQSIRGRCAAKRVFPVCIMNPVCYRVVSGNRWTFTHRTGLMGSMGTAGMPDFEALGVLAAKAQQGDDATYETLLLELYHYVEIVLRGRLGMVPELEDLVQTCLLAMHRSLPTYHPSRSLRPWVNAVIRYKLADYFRAQARRREFPQTDVVLDLANAGYSDSQGLADQVNVHDLLKQIPSDWAAAVRLTKFDGMSCEEAAGKEGISAAALRKRVSRAYKRLAVMIEKELES